MFATSACAVTCFASDGSLREHSDRKIGQETNSDIGTGRGKNPGTDKLTQVFISNAADCQVHCHDSKSDAHEESPNDLFVTQGS